MDSAVIAELDSLYDALDTNAAAWDLPHADKVAQRAAILARLRELNATDDLRRRLLERLAEVEAVGT